jgi:MSHA biogenesis protein MshK
MKELFQVPSSKFKVQGLTSRNVEPGTWNTEHATAAWALSAVLALVPAVASPQEMNDPTRPPTGFAAEAAADIPVGNRLQSVMISPTRSAAIINGVTVRLGEKYGDAVLVRVAESEVVLRSGGVQEVLKLHPGVDKREIVPVSVVAPAAATSAPRKAKAKPKTTPKVKAEAETTPKVKAEPNATTQRGAQPAADGNARTR